MLPHIYSYVFSYLIWRDHFWHPIWIFATFWILPALWRFSRNRQFRQNRQSPRGHFWHPIQIARGWRFFAISAIAFISGHKWIHKELVTLYGICFLFFYLVKPVPQYNIQVESVIIHFFSQGQRDGFAKVRCVSNLADSSNLGWNLLASFDQNIAPVPLRTIRKGSVYCDPMYSTFICVSPKGRTVSPLYVNSTSFVDFISTPGQTSSRK